MTKADKAILAAAFNKAWYDYIINTSDTLKAIREALHGRMTDPRIAAVQACSPEKPPGGAGAAEGGAPARGEQEPDRVH